MFFVEKNKNWESEKKDEFISNINSEDINELALLLNNLSVNCKRYGIFSLKILSVQVEARYD
jgi:hypothetical protein